MRLNDVEIGECPPRANKYRLNSVVGIVADHLNNAEQRFSDFRILMTLKHNQHM